MCLVVVALRVAPRYPLVVAANRDEHHARPSERAGWWPERPDMLAGRDLTAGGSWLAVDRRGRMAAVTNVRELRRNDAARSRGALVANFMAGGESAARYSAAVARETTAFAAFNLLVFDGRELHYVSNRAPGARLGDGLHTLSNAPRGIEWPKMASAGAGAHERLREQEPLEGLFELLAVRDTAAAPEERYRTAHFVVGGAYGTRCSTVLLIDDGGVVTFAERAFDAAGLLTGEVRETFSIRR